MKKVMLSNSDKVALIDDCDFSLVEGYTWYLDSHGYAGTNIKVKRGRGGQKKMFMHRLLLGDEKGKKVDHANHNRLDNRRRNIRYCNAAQNNMNRGLQRNNKSGCKGVVFSERDKVWIAKIGSKPRIHLGTFKNFEDARAARINAEKKLYKEFACTGGSINVGR